ncbi:MAG: alpha/beta fold hydrolase, partial [Candidatus Eremiobacterota bacterium]
MFKSSAWILGLAWLVACPAAAEPSRQDYFADQLAREVRATPTDPHNLPIRLHCLVSTARVLAPGVGQQRLDRVLSPRALQDLVAEVEQNRADLRLLDRGLTGLCELARQNNVLPNLQRVRFPTRSGATVVAYLFVPRQPSERALVFGHGGFGSKESWLDLMQAVTEETGCYTLTMDFEGCGESSGYTTWSGRVNDFSAAMDFLQERYSVRHFAVGGHSGGGAYPAACAALEDPRVRVLVLWDCIFDFYDTHLTPNAP